MYTLIRGSTYSIDAYARNDLRSGINLPQQQIHNYTATFSETLQLKQHKFA